MRSVDGSPATKLRKCLTLFAVGLVLQAGILFLAPAGKAQSGGAVVERSTGLPSLFGPITWQVSSRANVALDGPFVLTYTLTPSTTVITDTILVGRLDPGQRYLGVIANQGEVILGGDDVSSQTYTVTLKSLSPDFPLMVAPEVVADISGTHRQLTTLSGLTLEPIVISDTVVAQSPPLTFDVFRDYPGVVQQGNVYTATWQVGAANSPFTDTIVAAALSGGGVYESVIGQRAFCDQGISSFTCSIPALAPGELPAVITYASRALESGRNDHVLQLLGGGDALTVTTTATVVPAPILEVPIDIKPGGDENPINPRSHGNIPVAILSTDSFDVVAQLDQASLAFGPTGTEDSLLFCHPEDSNRDALLDLVCHFDTQAANFQRGDTEGIVTGVTFEGTSIRGSDSVFIVPHRAPKRISRRR